MATPAEIRDGIASLEARISAPLYVLLPADIVELSGYVGDLSLLVEGVANRTTHVQRKTGSA